MGSKKWHMCQEHLQTIEKQYHNRNEQLHWVSKCTKPAQGPKKNTSFELQSAPNLHRDKKQNIKTMGLPQENFIASQPVWEEYAPSIHALTIPPITDKAVAIQVLRDTSHYAASFNFITHFGANFPTCKHVKHIGTPFLRPSIKLTSHAGKSKFPHLQSTSEYLGMLSFMLSFIFSGLARHGCWTEQKELTLKPGGLR